MTGRTRPRRIMVTGVGAAPGFDLARSLLNKGCEVIGVDAHPLAPGLALPGLTPHVLPTATEESYTEALAGLCKHTRPDALVCAIEPELPRLIAAHQTLSELGVRTLLPNLDTVRACGDKAHFAAVLTQHGVPTPHTYLPHDINRIPEQMPLIVKPRHGHGAQDVHACHTREQARVLCELVDDPLIQERVQGQEFTADCLIDRTGQTSVILRHRLLVKGGLAVVSRTFHDERVTAHVKQTLAAVGAVGVCCVQGFVASEHIVMTEVNLRIAGAFSASEAAGADLVGQMLNLLGSEPVDHSALTYRPHIQTIKYVETLTSTRIQGGGR